MQEILSYFVDQEKTSAELKEELGKLFQESGLDVQSEAVTRAMEAIVRKVVSFLQDEHANVTKLDVRRLVDPYLHSEGWVDQKIKEAVETRLVPYEWHLRHRGDDHGFIELYYYLVELYSYINCAIYVCETSEEEARIKHKIFGERIPLDIHSEKEKKEAIKTVCRSEERFRKYFQGLTEATKGKRKGIKLDRKGIYRKIDMILSRHRNDQDE
jgi:hypothetical protein